VGALPVNDDERKIRYMVAGDNLDHGVTVATSRERMAAHRERKKKRQLRLSRTIGGEDADEMIRCGYDVRAADPAAAVAAAERFISDTIACLDTQR
jgi:hypothetical protein